MSAAYHLFDRAGCPALVTGASSGVGQALAQTRSPDGISANTIAPGFFSAELPAADLDNPGTVARIAVGRNGQLADREGAAAIFAVPARAPVTGLTRFCGGDVTAR